MSKTEDFAQFINIWNFWMVCIAYQYIVCLEEVCFAVAKYTHPQNEVNVSSVNSFLRNMSIKHRRVSIAYDKKLETCNRKRKRDVKRAFAQMQK